MSDTSNPSHAMFEWQKRLGAAQEKARKHAAKIQAQKYIYIKDVARGLVKWWEEMMSVLEADTKEEFVQLLAHIAGKEKMTAFGYQFTKEDERWWEAWSKRFRAELSTWMGGYAGVLREDYPDVTLVRQAQADAKKIMEDHALPTSWPTLNIEIPKSPYADISPEAIRLAQILVKMKPIVVPPKN
jgi:hypothetical protein